MIATLLAMRDLQYPQGWRQGAGYLAHDLYDIATLFHLGWDRADADLRARMAAALDDMLAWCLTETVRPDGTVRVDEADNSAETATYFAVGLLGELGTFDPAKRFWTSAHDPARPGVGGADRGSHPGRAGARAGCRRRHLLSQRIGEARRRRRTLTDIGRFGPRAASKEVGDRIMSPFSRRVRLEPPSSGGVGIDLSQSPNRKRALAPSTPRPPDRAPAPRSTSR